MLCMRETTLALINCYFFLVISFHHLSKGQSLIEIKIMKKKLKLHAVSFPPQKGLLHLIYWSTRIVVQVRFTSIFAKKYGSCYGTRFLYWYSMLVRSLN